MATASAIFSSATFRFATYVAWCLLWCSYTRHIAIRIYTRQRLDRYRSITVGITLGHQCDWGPVLGIRTGFNANPDTDPDPAFFVNADRIWIGMQIQGFDDQNLDKIYSRNFNIIFFSSKIAIYLSLRLH